MEQIEAGKRKTSKERYKRDTSKHREESIENEKTYQRRNLKKNSSSNNSVEYHNKNKRYNKSASNSAASSELTTPISEDQRHFPPNPPRRSSTRKERNKRDHHVSGPNNTEDDVDDMLPTSSRQPQINKSYVDKSWDCADQGERKTSIQHNQLKVYKEINYSGNCANIEDNILADDDVIEEGEDYELDDHHNQDSTQGKIEIYHKIIIMEFDQSNNLVSCKYMQYILIL